MCIMEVREGQKTTTIAQALAHNLSTSDRDFDMFIKVLESRKDTDTLVTVRHAQDLTHRAYAAMLEVYGEELEQALTHHHDHGTGTEHLEGTDEHASLTDLAAALKAGEQVGNERRIPSLVEAEHHDAELARRFETR
jgi:hypothetical protein